MLDGVAAPETDGPGGRFMSLVYCHEYQASVLAINAARLDSITFTPGMVFPPWETLPLTCPILLAEASSGTQSSYSYCVKRSVPSSSR